MPDTVVYKIYIQIGDTHPRNSVLLVRSKAVCINYGFSIENDV